MQKFAQVALVPRHLYNHHLYILLIQLGTLPALKKRSQISATAALHHEASGVLILLEVNRRQQVESKQY